LIFSIGGRDLQRLVVKVFSPAGPAGGRMDHPVMLLVWVLEKAGLGHFAHAYYYVAYTWFFALILIVAGRLVASRLQMVPGAAQNVAEAALQNIVSFQDGMMGPKGRPYLPLTATLIIFVFFCNFNGLIPGSSSPTANLNTTLALALIVVVTTHVVGIKTHGWRYVKHFMGPAPFLAPLMIVIETISHFARIISLSLRLFGNVMGEDLLLAILFLLAGQFFAPLPIMFLAVFTGFLQAFIITLLTMMYVSEALEHAH
jgi:F-type H+-transporting ATPase subunit a